MRKNIGLVWALALLAAAFFGPAAAAAPKICFPPAQPVPAARQARLEVQKSHWAPNGMKVLIIQGKMRFVRQPAATPLEKSGFVPILKEGV